MGWTISTMAWSIIDGQQWLTNQQYDGKSNLQWAIQTLEYGLEFLLDCSFENGEFVAQVCLKSPFSQSLQRTPSVFYFFFPTRSLSRNDAQV